MYVCVLVACVAWFVVPRDCAMIFVCHLGSHPLLVVITIAMKMFNPPRGREGGREGGRERDRA